MNPKRDAVIIISLILGLGLLSISFSATPRAMNANHANVKLPQPAEQTTKETTYSKTSVNSTATKKPESKTSSRDIEREIKKAEAEVKAIQDEIERIETYGENSPYRGMVVLKKRSYRSTRDDVDRQYAHIVATKNALSGITVSNWKIVSGVTGQSARIGEAEPLFIPGEEETDLPITLYAGDEVIVTTGRSPIGSSFRVNKCTGYFTQFQKFYPSISKKCPDPEDEILDYTKDTSIFIDNACMDFVERISKCTVQVKPIPISLSFACHEAIFEEINYNECVLKHKNDSDFYQDSWRVYLKRDSGLWRSERELIMLLDENGKTVDYYSY